MRSLLRLLLLLAACATASAGARAEEEARPVDVQLVLAVDSSSSVSIDEYYLQLEGYARAFSHPELWAAIRGGPRGAIAVLLFEWSGPRQQVVNFPWRVLDSEAALAAFSAELAVAPRLVIGGETALGDALAFAVALAETAPGGPARRVIDVSGDGRSNRGRPVAGARAEAVARGIVVNGLAIANEEPDLEDYYRLNVIGGPGAFVVKAKDYVDFAEVILRKLLREVRTVAEAPDARPPATDP
jgi:hypothetical protein